IVSARYPSAIELLARQGACKVVGGPKTQDNSPRVVHFKWKPGTRPSEAYPGVFRGYQLRSYERATYSTDLIAHTRRAFGNALLDAFSEAIHAGAAQHNHRASGPPRRGHLPDALRTVLRGHQLRRRRRALPRTGEESLVRVS